MGRRVSVPLYPFATEAFVLQVMLGNESSSEPLYAGRLLEMAKARLRRGVAERTVSSAVDQLERRGLVRKTKVHPGGVTGTLRELRLTATGRRLAERNRRLVLEVFR